MHRLLLAVILGLAPAPALADASCHSFVQSLNASSELIGQRIAVTHISGVSDQRTFAQSYYSGLAKTNRFTRGPLSTVGPVISAVKFFDVALLGKKTDHITLTFLSEDSVSVRLDYIKFAPVATANPRCMNGQMYLDYTWGNPSTNNGYGTTIVTLLR